MRHSHPQNRLVLEIQYWETHSLVLAPRSSEDTAGLYWNMMKHDETLVNPSEDIWNTQITDLGCPTSKRALLSLVCPTLLVFSVWAKTCRGSSNWLRYVEISPTSKSRQHVNIPQHTKTYQNILQHIYIATCVPLHLTCWRCNALSKRTWNVSNGSPAIGKLERLRTEAHGPSGSDCSTQAKFCEIWHAIFRIIPCHSISFRIIPYHSKSFHIIPYHSISFHIIPYHSISFHLIPYHSNSFQIIPYHSNSFHIIPYHSISLHIIPNHSNSFQIIPYNSVSFHFIPYHSMIWNDMEWFGMSFNITQCH